MANYEYSVAEEIADVSIGRPHVVILGAGASFAACAQGDKFGRKLPVMQNFVEVVGLQSLLEKYSVLYHSGENFEEIYSSLCDNEAMGDALGEIENAIHDYFSKLRLPDYPTIYDHLVLSLRPKDLVATFNWDPFLYQACFRNHRIAEMPNVAYLHGSVAVGYCAKDKRKGMRGSRCSVCGEKFVASRLLYPVGKKDYTSDVFIRGEWQSFKSFLEGAFLLTIFGYGAPKSDIEAVEAMKQAWGSVERRELEQTEIIDIRDKDELAEIGIHLYIRIITRSVGVYMKRSCPDTHGGLVRLRGSNT